MKINGIKITDSNLEEFYEFDKEEGLGGTNPSDRLLYEFIDKSDMKEQGIKTKREYLKENEDEVLQDFMENHCCESYKADEPEFTEDSVSIGRECEECHNESVLEFYLKPEYKKAKMED